MAAKAAGGGTPIEALHKEKRKFTPPKEFTKRADVNRASIKDGAQGSKELMEELKGHVTKKIGALARPDDLIAAADRPKTRSGNIMRRLLRDIAEGKALGDTTTLADAAAITKLKDQYGEEE
jgi:acyl-CoA synthetase (AMP-forming)/AMP-acid ligase II